MKRNLFLLFVIFSSLSVIASADIYPSISSFIPPKISLYSIKEFTVTGDKEPSIGLVDKNYVWTKVLRKNILICSPTDEGFVMGGVRPIANLNSIPSYDVSYKKLLRAAFSCFCKINSGSLDDTLLDMDGEDGHSLMCEDGVVKDYYHLGTGSCFAAGTKVSTPSGDKNIEEIKVGDEVLGYDHKKDIVTTSKVFRVFKHKNKKYGELSLSNETKLLVTREHPFYLVDKKKYVTADKLNPNDKLLLISNNKVETVTVIKYIKSVAKADVYNISVKDLKNYFVNKVLVHNKG